MLYRILIRNQLEVRGHRIAWFSWLLTLLYDLRQSRLYRATGMWTSEAGGHNKDLDGIIVYLRDHILISGITMDNNEDDVTR